MASSSVQSDDDPRARYIFRKLSEKANIDLAFAKGGAANDNLVRAPLGDFLGASPCSYAAADANFQFVAFAGAEAEFAGQRVVISSADGRIEVDKMQPLVRFEFFE